MATWRATENKNANDGVRVFCLSVTLSATSLLRISSLSIAYKALSGTVLYLPNLCTGESPAESFGSGPLCEGPPAPALTADQKKNRSAFSDVCPSVLNYRLFKQRQHLRNFQTK